jgi:hypothetical protein
MYKKQIKEGLAELAGAVDQDHEVQMARADLYKIAKYAIKLHEMLKNISEAEGLEGWQQAKITKAADYISSVYHNLEHEQTVQPRPFATAMSESEKIEYKTVLEKAKSRAQQKFMGMVYAAKKGEKPASKAVAKVAKGMSKKAARDYAATKHKGKPEHVKEAEDDTLPTVSGRQASSPYQAQQWRDDAEQKSDRALEQHPDFFNDDHMRRVKQIYQLINDTLGPERLYVNHRSGTKNTGPFTVIKAVYPTWPKDLRRSSSVRQKKFYDPIKQMGGVAGNLASQPGIMIRVFNK